jgi:hypothetical protein
MVDIPRRAAALAAWISSSAPDLATLPEMLWRTGVSSGGQAAQDWTHRSRRGIGG